MRRLLRWSLLLLATLLAANVPLVWWPTVTRSNNVPPLSWPFFWGPLLVLFVCLMLGWIACFLWVTFRLAALATGNREPDHPLATVANERNPQILPFRQDVHE
jgi:hypothetical protein